LTSRISNQKLLTTERPNTPSPPLYQKVTVEATKTRSRQEILKQKWFTWCLGALVANLVLCTGTKIKSLKRNRDMQKPGYSFSLILLSALSG
jgi:hypothetical protein